MVSAIGKAPALTNPNLAPLDPPAAFLVQATAQGLVQFDASGQIEPALAQRWIVSDDGLRYTFRLAHAEWANGGKVTAQQVAARLKAAAGGPSRNPLKPLLGAIDEIEAMTDEVLEISLKAPRPNFLQLLAQPEMAIMRNGNGSGPYGVAAGEKGEVVLSYGRARADDDQPSPVADRLVLRGESAALATARFRAGAADLVIGGTAGDLPIARAADEAGQALRFDPVAGLFGLIFRSNEGPLESADVRRALSMAVDREALVALLGVPDLQPRTSLLPQGLEVPTPSLPDWSAAPLAARRTAAAALISAQEDADPISVRVAVPDAPGYRLVFALLNRDWRAIGVTAQAVRPGEAADLELIDRVAPVAMASWYLRSFSCEATPICSPEADGMMLAARLAPTAAERRDALANADRLLSADYRFIPLAAPVRWSLVSARLSGFRPNMFGRHAVAELISAPR